MEWVLKSPQIHSTFSNLGFPQADGYHVNENCNVALETILRSILTEDKNLRTYRRNISSGQYIQKDLVPLLIHAKNDKTVELITSILVNLTIPIECLLSVDSLSKNDNGRHTVFEINNLLIATKNGFTDDRATKVVIDFLKKNVDADQKGNLSQEQCANISNSLLLIRNILHIPEEMVGQNPNNNGAVHMVQNKILWNIFSQGVDKILIKLMTMPDANNWGVTMVQLTALLYKDQHVVNLQKLVNLWLETALSESSEDNESNTSPQNRGVSDDSSPMLTSDPTSDSSDTNGSGKNNNGANNGPSNGPTDGPTNGPNNGPSNGPNNGPNNEPNNGPTNEPSNGSNNGSNNESNNGWVPNSIDNNVQSNTESVQPLQKENKVTEEKTCSDNNNGNMKLNNEMNSTPTSENGTEIKETSQNKGEKQIVISETSDCGYGTQIENQESISTSSNEEDMPTKKAVHQKPHNAKQRTNTKVRTGLITQDRKRKKVVKRAKSNIINVNGLSHKTPTDDDISNVIKEFTVDFLLKGYNGLVQTLHSEILSNIELQIDTSHFFWLLTYFLKFASQIELDLKHICSVLSYDIVSYLTAEGVSQCEQFELAIRLGTDDLTPRIRRLHLVVTAIREFVQAIEAYKKFSHLTKNDRELLNDLQIKMCETEELRSLLVLLLRHYNPKYHSKQYLQDIIVTNHILLMFLENVMQLPDYNCSITMPDHLEQFATHDVMNKYGMLLEDYAVNGEYVNDCIFTLMHHVCGDHDNIFIMFQPKILNIFNILFKSDFEICDDWSDLIEHVIHSFLKKPSTYHNPAKVRPKIEPFDEDKALTKRSAQRAETKKKSRKNSWSDTSQEIWNEEELSSLSWTYMQCSAKPDVIGEMIKLFKEDGIIKSRTSIVKELFRQNIISKGEYEKYVKSENVRSTRRVQVINEIRDKEIGKLCDQLSKDGKSKFLDWVQKALLEACHAKLYLEKVKKDLIKKDDSKLLNFELFKKKCSGLPVMSPISYHSLLLSQSIPLVPWNCKQAAVCKDLKFLQLLHKLGFHMPVDSGKFFIRIPHFWSPDYMYDVAGKISPVDPSKLRFSIDELSARSVAKFKSKVTVAVTAEVSTDISGFKSTVNFYQVHKQNATMVNYTPMPGTSFNRGGGEIDKQNWLELVQKSQEFKLTLNVEGTTEDEGNQEDLVMQSDTDIDNHVASDTLAFPGTSATMGAPLGIPFMIPPTIMTVTHNTPHFDVLPSPDPELMSLCDTASVTSDLTRMYVSDEDDKPDALDIDTLSEADSDIDHRAAKRCRLHL